MVACRLLGDAEVAHSMIDAWASVDGRAGNRGS